jgi:K+-sensing histidine kinase KdpD
MNETLRRDPDAIIERIRQDEHRAIAPAQVLRLFAGVGKTYAMLIAARA